MIFKLHYWLLTAGASACGILLGVFIQTYTDATPIEMGLLFMAMPFSGLITRPLICSFADRYQAHQKFMLYLLLIVGVTYSPFVIIPMLGESFYGKHPRLCWYILVAVKMIGSSAFNGVVSIGDSLAINYAHRIGTDFGVYRVWGTISWIVFGLIIGQINEIWFLPKYVPGFMILILCAFLNMSLYWLWPKEYFLMVTKREESIEKEVDVDLGGGRKAGSLSQMTKSLMPKELVLEHMKGKLCSLFSCFFCGSKKSNKHEDEKAESIKIGYFRQALSSLSTSEKEPEAGKNSRGISKMTSLRILVLLIKRDVRILLYFVVFILFGFNNITFNFFFISLSNLCTKEVDCNYSRLAGMLQVSMALAETVLLMHVKEVERFLGRVNMAGISFLLITIKFTFYGTIWESVSPFFSLISELVNGIIYGMLLTVQVEVGHMFANEVQYVIPELIKRKVVSEEEDVEKLKLSLSATMQALMTSASDGIGSGFGALIYGLVIDRYSYRALWVSIAICAGVACCIIFLISVVDNVMHLNIGLDKKAELETERRMALRQLSNNSITIAVPVPVLSILEAKKESEGKEVQYTAIV